MFKEGDYIRWTNAAGISAGTGHIRGVAVAEQAVIGRGYIVELDRPIPRYDYSHIVLFECHLKLCSETNQIEGGSVSEGASAARHTGWSGWQWNRINYCK